jgi:hypothetical protein
MCSLLPGAGDCQSYCGAMSLLARDLVHPPPEIQAPPPNTGGDGGFQYVVELAGGECSSPSLAGAERAHPACGKTLVAGEKQPGI